MSRVSLRGLRTQPTQVENAGGHRGTLRGALRTSLRVSATATVALALTVGAMAGSAEASVSKPDARNDSVTVKYGTHATVNVLRNDRVARKATAHVKVTGVQRGISARLSGKRIVVTVPAKAKSGTYRVKYRVTDYRHKKDAAYVLVRVPARPASGGTTGGSTGGTSSLPAVLEKPGAPVVYSITCKAVNADTTIVTWYWRVTGGRYTNVTVDGTLTRITSGQAVTGAMAATVHTGLAQLRSNPVQLTPRNVYWQIVAPLNYDGRDPSKTTVLTGDPQPADLDAVNNC